MTTLDAFRYAGQEVRTVIVDGEPWFVIADVAKVLGLSNPTMVANGMFPDDLSSAEVIDSMGRAQTARTVNEPGLYRMIFQSRKAEAADFQRWVTREVLPQIRRTGQFGSQLPGSFAEALELAAVKVRELEAAEAKIVADAPKVAAYEALMDAEGFYTMEAAAKLGGVGRTTFYNSLRAARVFPATGRLPYQRYMHWFKITTSTFTDGDGVMRVSSTPRVRPEFLSAVLAKAGVKLGVRA